MPACAPQSLLYTFTGHSLSIVFREGPSPLAALEKLGNSIAFQFSELRVRTVEINLGPLVNPS